LTVGRVEQVLTALDDCVRRGIRTKINAVLLPETRDEPPRLAALAAGRPVDVRFIELMPIGEGRGLKGVSPDEALARLRAVWRICTPRTSAGATAPLNTMPPPP
jgi:cyclic pyranopterin phosphate synthase